MKRKLPLVKIENETKLTQLRFYCSNHFVPIESKFLVIPLLYY